LAHLSIKGKRRKITSNHVKNDNGSLSDIALWIGLYRLTHVVCLFSELLPVIPHSNSLAGRLGFTARGFGT
jgi:hypothetical protein